MRLPVTLAIALVAVGCGSTTAPTAQPPVVVVPPPVTPPVVQQTIETATCPTSGPADLPFFREMACNAFETPLQPTRRWTVAPKVYLKTIDEAGAPVDVLTLDTVQNAMIEIASVWTNGKFGLEGVLRGTDSREGVSGWITVKWPATAPASSSCGQADVGRDGGVIEFNYKIASCSCNGSQMRPRTARHELGHAFGYYHTDSASDLMSGQGVAGCDASLSSRERQAASYHYR